MALKCMVEELDWSKIKQEEHGAEGHVADHVQEHVDLVVDQDHVVVTENRDQEVVADLEVVVDLAVLIVNQEADQEVMKEVNLEVDQKVEA